MRHLPAGLQSILTTCSLATILVQAASSSPAPAIQTQTGSGDATFQAGNLTLTQGTSIDIAAFTLLMQSDGNLVLYQQNGPAVWSSGTYGQNCGTNQCVAVFQSDGNLVVYQGSTTLWSSGTYGNPGAELVLSSQSPHLSILNSNQSLLWANELKFSAGNFTLMEGTSIRVGSLELAMQTDGNLVLYQPDGTAAWSTATSASDCGTNRCLAIFQTDGNFVVYDGSVAIWRTGANNNPAAILALSSQLPNLEVLDASQSVLWSNVYVFSAGNLTLPQGATVYDGGTTFTMQTNTNLSLHVSAGNRVDWYSGNSPKDCSATSCVAVFQTDGNLVIYSGSTAVWSTKTYGNPTAKLTFNFSAPELRIVRPDQSVIWSASPGCLIINGAPWLGC